MKIIPLAIAISLAAPCVHATPEITPADLARHLGIHFWKFGREDLPPRFSVALLEIKDGKIAGAYLGAFSSLHPGDLVVGLESRSGGLEATISIGSSLMGLGSAARKDIGISAKLEHAKVPVGMPIVLAGDYRPAEGRIVITGKIEDVASGVALLIEKEE